MGKKKKKERDNTQIWLFGNGHGWDQGIWGKNYQENQVKTIVFKLSKPCGLAISYQIFLHWVSTSNWDTMALCQKSFSPLSPALCGQYYTVTHGHVVFQPFLIHSLNHDCNSVIWPSCFCNREGEAEEKLCFFISYLVAFLPFPSKVFGYVVLSDIKRDSDGCDSVLDSILMMFTD